MKTPKGYYRVKYDYQVILTGFPRQRQLRLTVVPFSLRTFCRLFASWLAKRDIFFIRWDFAKNEGIKDISKFLLQRLKIPVKSFKRGRFCISGRYLHKIAKAMWLKSWSIENFFFTDGAATLKYATWKEYWRWSKKRNVALTFPGRETTLMYFSHDDDGAVIWTKSRAMIRKILSHFVKPMLAFKPLRAGYSSPFIDNLRKMDPSKIKI